jgi:tRNA-dihydrouridine synthase 3
MNVDLASVLNGAVVMAPMTKGSNLPYRRLAVEFGARVLIGEMALARRLRQKRRGEFALIRRFEGEPCFAVQLAGNDPQEMAWAAALAEARGADFVDVNLGCPIDLFTRKGLGAALARQPQRVRRIVEAMCQAVRVPVTVKIRLGWDDKHLNYLSLAAAAVDGGAAAIFVHGRTRDARYRYAANWDAIGEVAASVPVPVVGNGDLLFPHEVVGALARSGCRGVMVARGALIKPWLFKEVAAGVAEDVPAEDRVTVYRRYVALAKEHWGTDAHGLARVAEFTRWHVGFWWRYRPRRADGSFPAMQERDSDFEPRSPLEALLARGDSAALDYVADRLLQEEALVADAVPAPGLEPDGARRLTEVRG